MTYNPLKSIVLPGIDEIRPQGLIVIVGPNSSGKTQLLRDIQNSALGMTREFVVCRSLHLNKPPNFDLFYEHMKAQKYIKETYNTSNQVMVESISPSIGYNTPKHWSMSRVQLDSWFGQFGTDEPILDGIVQPIKFLEHFGRFFITSMFLDRRLSLSSEVANFDYENAGPTNELQALHINRVAQELLNEQSQRAFGKAVWLDYSRGGVLCLRVADRSKLPDPADRLYAQDIRKYKQIDQEGDGYKSYMAICISLLLGRRPICLIDEPEMCLHPPQAHALGRFIGEHGTADGHATLVSTHSSHVLRGIIETAGPMQVIRLSRPGSRFAATIIDNNMLRECISKPSTKVETILDGIFADAVTVVESEGDRLVYGAAWEKVSPDFGRDTHFVSVGGIGGFADTVNLYRKLEIPCCVISDLDLVREVATFSRIAHSMGSGAAEVESIIRDCQDVVGLVQELGPLVSKEELQSRLATAIASPADWGDAEAIGAIRKLLAETASGLSPSARLKLPIDTLKGHTEIHSKICKLIKKCRQMGLFLVPVGELEGWLSAHSMDAPSKRKKAEWANWAASRIRLLPATQGDIWEFVRQTATYQMNEASRLGGYDPS